MKRWVPVAAVLVVACSGGAAEVSTTVPAVVGERSPEAAVLGLLDALRQRDFEAAAIAVEPRQMVLILLAEGGATNEAVAIDRVAVAKNFWFGFADALGPESLAMIELAEDGLVNRFEVRGVEFAVVPIAIGDERRVFVARHEPGGWVVDVVASFAEVLGSRYSQGIERVLNSPEETALMADLTAQIPSMLAVLEVPGFADGSLQQAMLLAVDLLGG